MRLTRIAAICISALCVVGPAVNGQNRLEILSQDQVPGTSGLRMLTIRDNQLSSCFTVFIQEPAASSVSIQTAVPEPTPAADAKQQSIDRIRAAAESREQKLAALKAQFEAWSGGSYEQWAASPQPLASASALSSVPVGLLPGVPVGVIPDGIAVQRYETKRKAIEDEYEHALRSEIPGSFPPATLAPGMRTGGFEDAANATRRATLDPDTTSTMKTLTDDVARLHEELRQLSQAPHLAASGPFACPASTDTKRPAR